MFPLSLYRNFRELLSKGVGNIDALNFPICASRVQ